jgi:hypothetical protein
MVQTKPSGWNSRLTWAPGMAVSMRVVPNPCAPGFCTVGPSTSLHSNVRIRWLFRALDGHQLAGVVRQRSVLGRIGGQFVQNEAEGWRDRAATESARPRCAHAADFPWHAPRAAAAPIPAGRRPSIPTAPAACARWPAPRAGPRTARSAVPAECRCAACSAHGPNRRRSRGTQGSPRRRVIVGSAGGQPNIAIVNI